MLFKMGMGEHHGDEDEIYNKQQSDWETREEERADMWHTLEPEYLIEKH